MDSQSPIPDLPLPWTVNGSIPKAKITARYRFAAALVAFAMILLPIVYLGIIAATGWWVYDYASAGPGLGHRSGRATIGKIFLFLIPIVMGVSLILFMIKPFFHRRQKAVENRTLKREDEPELFAFIDEICDLVRAPRPRRVQVDMQVNASASLTHGIWSILTRNLTLTIGLPLAGGLNVRQFGGVLAHEFGHFAQGAGMGTTYIVRMVSMWFARVVYERDRWDAALESLASQSDWRIAIILQLTRLLIWLVRRILWALMMVGHLFSSVLMRQMEFDADHYEIQTAGSDSFTSTARQMRLLNVGAHITHSKQGEAYQAKRLVDDLAGWMLHETKRLTPDTQEKILSAAKEEKTGWLDTHPCDAERIQRAEAAQSTGVLSGEETASVLFQDFAALSREITFILYRDFMNLPANEIALQPLSTMTGESDAVHEGGEAMHSVFHKLLTSRTLTVILPSDLNLAFFPEQVPPAETTEEELGAAKELDESLDRQNELTAAFALNEAKIPIDLKQFKLTGSSGVGNAAEEAKRNTQRLDAAIALATPVVERARSRVILGLRWLIRQGEHADELNRLASTLESMQPIFTRLLSMRPLVVGAMAILNRFDNSSDKQAAFNAAKHRSDQLQPLNQGILRDMEAVPYPFHHAKGKVTLRHYLVEGISHPDAMALTLMQSDAILDRLFAIYARAIGRMAALCLVAENSMHTDYQLPPAFAAKQPTPETSEVLS